MGIRRDVRKGAMVGLGRLTQLQRLRIFLGALAEMGHEAPTKLFYHLDGRELSHTFDGHTLLAWCEEAWMPAADAQPTLVLGTVAADGDGEFSSSRRFVSIPDWAIWILTFTLADGRPFRCVGTADGGGWISIPPVEMQGDSPEAGFNARLAEQLGVAIQSAEQMV